MKKLKIKVFGTIFFILTFFLSIVLIFFNYQSYRTSKNNVQNILLRLNDNHIKEPPNHFGNNIRDKFFIDSVVYTVLFNNNEITEIINHNELVNNASDVEEYAYKIINSNNKKTTKISNLYFSKYSYSFVNNNSLVIIDNSTFSNVLLPLLQMSIIIFILLECLFIFITNKLTSWIIRPVEESFEKQRQFIADASHELKTPLTVILANTEALEKDRNENKWFNNIKNEIERMNNLIINLLDLAKLENNNSNNNYFNNNLSKLVEMEILTFESLIYEKNLILDYNISPNIMFNCDKDQIKQLVAILLDNAIKHSYDRSPIIINLYIEKKDIILEVKNKGNELSKEDEEKIFERFYRVDESRNRDSNRYGLGLAIAKNIVLNHKGIISASSSNNETTFKIIFKQV